MKCEIRNRYTGAVQFTAEIDCADDAPESLKKRLAVLWAFGNGANLSDANLSGADLSGACPIDANLIGACGVDDRIIDGGLRGDGYRFAIGDETGEGGAE